MKRYLQQNKMQIAVAACLLAAVFIAYLIDPTYAAVTVIGLAGVSTAYSAQGTTLKVGTASAAKTITAATQANPGVFTATAHGFVNGQVVALAGIVGMTQANGRAGVAIVLSANTFSIAGLDTTAFTPYTSGGTATPSQIQINNVRTLSGLDGQRNEIDITNLSSTAEEVMLGIARFGGFQMEVDLDDTDQGQMVLHSAQVAAYASPYVMTLPNGKVRNFTALCKQFSENVGVDQVHRGTAQLRITGPVVYG
jgi:hypothetical protein